MATADVLVDSNVILDLVTNDPVWFSWSVRQLEAAALSGSLFVNDVVFAEVASRYQHMGEVEELFEGMGLVMEPIPRPALFLAGHAHLAYRERGGTRTGVLSDFFIGAHAAITGRQLLTRDRGRYATYFPTVELITP